MEGSSRIGSKRFRGNTRDENIHSFRAGRIVAGAKEGWNKVVYRHRSIFLRWFASLHIRRLGTGNISSDLPPPSHRPSSAFLHRLQPPARPTLSRSPLCPKDPGPPAARRDTTGAIRRFEKRITGLSLRSACRGEENNAFQRRNSHVRMLVSLARRLDCRCFSINLTFRVFHPPSSARWKWRAVEVANVTERVDCHRPFSTSHWFLFPFLLI